MKLSAYIKKQRITAAEFAARIGVNKSTVSRWIESEDHPQPLYRPNWSQIDKIVRETDGDVTANDFMPGSSTGRLPSYSCSAS